jgi:hypothetical protein
MNSRNIAALISITQIAREGKILRKTRAAVLATNHMVDLMGKSRVGFIKQAVFALTEGAGLD